MPLNLTSVFNIVNNVKRNLFFESDITMKFMRQNSVLLELETGWFMQKEPTSSIADKALSSTKGFEEFFECSVAVDDDSIDLDVVMLATTSVVVGEDKYALKAYVRPRPATKKWNLRLTTFGKA